jgi:uncharacterized protein YndB with AHSA1/START domain
VPKKARPPRSVTDSETILAVAHIEAPPERIFRALTTKEAERWWGSGDTYRITDWQNDLRVGGQWSLIVVLAGGAALRASGEYLEIDAPRKFVQTRRYDWDAPGIGRRETVVTFRLDPIEGGTRVTIRHDGFAGIWDAAIQHASGWERFLAWLAAYLES